LKDWIFVRLIAKDAVVARPLFNSIHGDLFINMQMLNNFKS